MSTPSKSSAASSHRGSPSSGSHPAQQSNQILWQPSEERMRHSQLCHFIEFLRQHDDFSCGDLNQAYPALHQWSIQNRTQFWRALWEFFGVKGDMGERILENDQHMPGASWFADAKLNFAENLLKHAERHPNAIALIERGEHGRRETITFSELKHKVADIRHYLHSQGVEKGDCVAGFLPNSQYAIIAMLATASMGAIWTSCSPDFGLQGVLDRFQQTRPKILFACDGYYYANKVIQSHARVNEICAALPSLRDTVWINYLNEADQTNSCTETNWSTLLGKSDGNLSFQSMDFNAPLYVMYSSGTTGKPKCIVHSAGGTLLQHLKEHALHTDVSAESQLFYYTTCGWMMWNWLVSGLALGATLVLYDGSPFHSNKSCLFDLIDEEAISIFGSSAKYFSACEKYDLKPKQSHSLSSLNTILSTGSPLSPESFDYLYRDVKTDMCLSSISGGTDIISCFSLGCPILPVYRGELQCLGLAMDVAFVDDSGEPLSKGKGELVCRQNFPSMPSGFWNDPDGEKYREAYFSRFANTWAHGDYGEIIEHFDEKGQLTQVGAMIHGRSDAVLNPGGVRIGTAEIYRQVEKIPEVFESIAIGQSWKNDVRVILFVRLNEGHQLSDALIKTIKTSIRNNTTPRHVPAKIIQVADIPRTISGKIVELAVKKIIEGQTVNNTEALANPEALDLYKAIPALQED